jgi:hypothetical protein
MARRYRTGAGEIPSCLYDRAVTSRYRTILLTLLIVFTAARVTTTYRVFSQTMDEPFHLAAGYDFLLTGRQTSDPQHPPLARVFFGLPFLRTPPPATMDGLARGNALLLHDDHYTQNLGRARIGNLVFLVIGIAAVALWARDLISPAISPYRNVGESIRLQAAVISVAQRLFVSVWLLGGRDFPLPWPSLTTNIVSREVVFPRLSAGLSDQRGRRNEVSGCASSRGFRQ